MLNPPVTVSATASHWLHRHDCKHRRASRNGLQLKQPERQRGRCVSELLVTRALAGLPSTANKEGQTHLPNDVTARAPSGGTPVHESSKAGRRTGAKAYHPNGSYGRNGRGDASSPSRRRRAGCDRAPTSTSSKPHAPQLGSRRQWVPPSTKHRKTEPSRRATSESCATLRAGGGEVGVPPLLPAGGSRSSLRQVSKGPRWHWPWGSVHSASRLARLLSDYVSAVGACTHCRTMRSQRAAACGLRQCL